MPKRKATSSSLAEELPIIKQRTRSNTLMSLSTTQLVASTPRRHSTRRGPSHPPGIPAALLSSKPFKVYGPRARARIFSRFDYTSHKENDGSGEETDDEGQTKNNTIPIEAFGRRARAGVLACHDHTSHKQNDLSGEETDEGVQMGSDDELNLAAPKAERQTPSTPPKNITCSITPPKRTRSGRLSQPVPKSLVVAPRRAETQETSRFRTPNKTRQILHSVEITTPSKNNFFSRPQSPTSQPKLSTPGLPRTTGNQESLLALEFFLPSPAKSTPIIPQASPIRVIRAPLRTLPPHLHSCLHAQKRAVMKALQDPPLRLEEDDEEDGSPTNVVALEQLTHLLTGTIERGEGNSCLVLGPRGSGKTRIVTEALRTFLSKPIVIRLSGYAQQNDRLAMREIVRQLSAQTGSCFLSNTDSEDVTIDADADRDPFADIDSSITLPPSAHLSTLISILPTLSRPTVVVLDAFDLFATHARQGLLYCLLDTAQNCRATQGNRGLAVIGLTSSIDTVNLLEKRVKSRFSGRILRTSNPRSVGAWKDIARKVLCTSIDVEEQEEWNTLWTAAIDQFLDERSVTQVLNETFGLTRDMRMLSRILTTLVLKLSPSSPFPVSVYLAASATAQRCPSRFPFLPTLPYPAMCLLIAAIQSQTTGHDVFTFEMLHECFRDQVRMSLSAPVHVEGGGIGMVECTRPVLMGAFERLVSMKLFLAVTTPSVSVAREFVRYRCAAAREEVKGAVEKRGQTNLKRWLGRAQVGR